MKTSERHQLKQNEVAAQLGRMTDYFSGHGSRTAWLLGAVVVLIVAAGAFWTWRQNQAERAGALLADAMAVSQSEVVPADSGRLPPPGSFPTPAARAEEAVKKFRGVIEQYPSTPAATTARFEAASLLASVGKNDDAARYFREVQDGDGGIHGRMARMALAELDVRSGKYDQAIATYRDLSARKDGDLPVDGVLMQLGRAYLLAGKRAEALQTYQRILSEFPESIYATDARREVDSLKSTTVS